MQWVMLDIRQDLQAAKGLVRGRAAESNLIGAGLVKTQSQGHCFIRRFDKLIS
jgi:hypothetical protein